MAQASFDAYMLPRHISIYSGMPIEVPSHLVQRVCGTGMEVILQAADLIKLGKVDLALGVGTESMSRNPIAAYTHRGGFRMGQVEFKDFLWEALLDPSCDATMGGTQAARCAAIGAIANGLPPIGGIPAARACAPLASESAQT